MIPNDIDKTDRYNKAAALTELRRKLKTAFDRLFAVAECNPNYCSPKKENVLIMAAEGYGFEEKPEKN